METADPDRLILMVIGSNEMIRPEQGLWSQNRNSPVDWMGGLGLLLQPVETLICLSPDGHARNLSKTLPVS
jgi:hypothetical protein